MKICPRCGNKKIWQYYSGQEHCSNCGLNRKFDKTVLKRTRIST